MQLAIEERELSKMAAVSKQDEELQTVLARTNKNLQEREDELMNQIQETSAMKEQLTTENEKLNQEIKVSNTHDVNVCQHCKKLTRAIKTIISLLVYHRVVK